MFWNEFVCILSVNLLDYSNYSIFCFVYSSKSKLRSDSLKLITFSRVCSKFSTIYPAFGISCGQHWNSDINFLEILNLIFYLVSSKNTGPHLSWDHLIRKLFILFWVRNRNCWFITPAVKYFQLLTRISRE